MRQVNFTIIFVFCLAMVLFGLENTESVTINLIQGVSFQAPLAVELLLSLGIGAILAWVFSVWVGLQRFFESRREFEEIEIRETQIAELQQDVERYKSELQEQQRLLPAANTGSSE